MRYLLIPFLAFFLPGYMALFAVVIIALGGSLRWDLPLETPQKWFLAWLVWALLGCCLSIHPLLSIVGNPIRMQGWLFWFLCFAVARKLSLAGTDDLKDLWFSTSMLVLLVLWSVMYFSGWSRLPMVLSANLGVVIASVLASVHPIGIVYGALPIFVSGYRSAVFAALVAVAVTMLLSRQRKFHVMAVVAIIVIGLLGTYKIGRRMRSLDLGNLGSGTRTQLVLQADRIMWGHSRDGGNIQVVRDGGKPFYAMVESWRPMPKRRVFTGVGLDMGMYYLSAGVGSTCPADDVPDRIHNIAADILLQTGWIGYALALCCLGSCIWIVWNYRSTENIMYLSIIAGWIAMGLFNPQGDFFNLMMVIGVFGINRRKE